MDFLPLEIIYKQGTKCETATDVSSCMQQVDTLVSNTGFDVECLLGYCFKYIVSTKGDRVEIWNNEEALKLFFGPIDTKSEALWLVRAAGYRWEENDKKGGAIRKEGDSFHMIVLKMVSSCNPVRTNKFLLEVATDGSIHVKKQKKYSIDRRSCI